MTFAFLLFPQCATSEPRCGQWPTEQTGEARKNHGCSSASKRIERQPDRQVPGHGVLCEGALQPVRRLLPAVEDRPGIVDRHVDGGSWADHFFPAPHPAALPAADAMMCCAFLVLKKLSGKPGYPFTQH